MNLFARAKSILRQMRDATLKVSAAAKLSEGDDYAGEFVCPVSLDVSYIDDRETQDNETEVVVNREEGKSADIEKVREGYEHFVGALLNFALNPLKDGEPSVAEEDLKIGVAPSDVKGAKQGDVMLVVQDMNLSDVPFTRAMLEIDRYEKLAFGPGWLPGEEGWITKGFASENERQQVEHLLCCMAEVFGLEEELQENFAVADHENYIIMKKDFLALLAEREQSLEAAFGDLEDEERGMR